MTGPVAASNQPSVSCSMLTGLAVRYLHLAIFIFMILPCHGKVCLVQRLTLQFPDIIDIVRTTSVVMM